MEAHSPADWPIDHAVIRRASEWMARLWSDEASAADQAACTAWRAAHPDHERAWRRLQALEGQLASVPRTVARRVLLEPVPRSAARRDVLRLFVAAMAGGGAVYGARHTRAWQRATADQSTGTGEIRDLTLPDGTRVVLDTASAIDVRYTDAERRVVLRAGRILVTTAPDPRPVYRPFRIECGQGTVRALGTRFTVQEQGGRAEVAVYEGAVEIRPAQRPASAARLDAGQGAAFSGSQVQAPWPVQDNALAWERGLLVAERLRVADFVAALARYRGGILSCDSDVADLRVTGVFPLRDTDRALADLEVGVPVRVLYRTRYWATVTRR